MTAFDSDLGTTLNGEWHNNSTSVSNSHTQSPCAAATAGCGVGGGMDDRFDFQLMTGELLDGEGLDTIANSYHAFGNGGGVWSEPTPAHGFEHSIRVTVPPLGCLLLKNVKRV